MLEAGELGAGEAFKPGVGGAEDAGLLAENIDALNSGDDENGN